MGSKKNFPSSLVDGEEREMDYCNMTLQLNERGRDRPSRVGPPRVQGAARLLFPKIAKSRRTVVEIEETDYCTLPLQLNNSFNNNVLTELDNELPKGKTGEQGAPLGVQEAVAGRGKDDKGIGLGSLSPGLDTVYWTRMYVIVDPEMERNGSLKVGSRLQPKITRAVLNDQFEVVTAFTRYLSDKERLFQIIMEDLLRHREAIQASKLPIMLKDDVPCLRLIANKRMAYLTETYRRLKDTISETDKDSIVLMRVHIKRCIPQYHPLIPQLDLIETQWEISIEAVLYQKNFVLPKLKSKTKEGDSEHIHQARSREQPLVEGHPWLEESSAGSSQKGETPAEADQGHTIQCPSGAKATKHKQERIVAYGNGR
jgi:hypothetical protein